MSKPGKTTETKVEFIRENGGPMRKTTITTTIVSETANGALRTKKSTQIKTQKVSSESDVVEQVTTKFEELTAGDVSDEEHDPKNAMSPEDTEKFGEECVKEINKYRQKHSADKLKEDTNLTAKAQKHADKMLAENKLSTIQGVSLGKDVAKHWYEEGKDYDYGINEFVKGKGNFTQIIWKNSKKVGVGVASNKDGATFTIALFDPPGNVQSQYRENVTSK